MNLKKCPFCGGEIFDNYCDYERKMDFSCTNCDYDLTFVDLNDESEGIIKWNNRYKEPDDYNNKKYSETNEITDQKLFDIIRNSSNYINETKSCLHVKRVINSLYKDVPFYIYHKKYGYGEYELLKENFNWYTMIVEKDNHHFFIKEKENSQRTYRYININHIIFEDSLEETQKNLTNYLKYIS